MTELGVAEAVGAGWFAGSELGKQGDQEVIEGEGIVLALGAEIACEEAGKVGEAGVIGKDFRLWAAGWCPIGLFEIFL